MSITPCASVLPVAATISPKPKARSRPWPTAPPMAEREIAQAQDAMLSGKTGGCAMHLSQALRDESMTQTPYPEMAPAPFANTAVTTQGPPQQPQFNWTPMKGAY